MKWPILILFAIALLPSPTREIAASPAVLEVAVFAHEKVPVDSLSLSELRSIALGDKQYWGQNLRVTVLLRSPGAHERQVALKKVYRMDEAQFRQYWIGKVFRAEAPTGPKFVSNGQIAAELVASIPGSITFLDASQAPPKGAKLIRIDGKKPEERGYPLR